VEPSATNLALQSENFGTTWTQTNLLAFGSGSVLNTTGTLDPFGGNSADLIVANTTPAVQHRVDQVTASASGSYTFSVFVKAAGYNFCRLRIGNAGGDFNINTGVVTVTDAGIVTSIRPFGNGWYRCIISKAASTANETVRINMQPASNTGDFAGDGISGIYVFGAQYETGSIATSYIPTTTQAITRGAEVVNKTGVSSLIGQTEGTIYAEVDARNFTSGARIFAISDGTQDNRIVFLFNSTNRIRALISFSVTTQFDANTSTGLSSGIYKLAVAYANNDFAFYVNGSQIATDNTGSVPACSQVFIGKTESTSTSNTCNDRIRAVALYPTRLTNAQLQALTT
jgi:hypothetical protein